ncbi:MAG: hypothetical protein AMJ53_11910 [Gammaproteobacteria bacterium SG8_11]|nr:MAG: hypothetical protein AMJ53_11910 [Gammaproteobacteria bacterium SG8_11]
MPDQKTKNSTKLRSLAYVLFLGILTTSATMGVASAGWRDLVDEVKTKLTSSTKSGLSSSEVAEGLKEALTVGSKKSIDILGNTDGFYKDNAVRIPMPEQLKQVDKLLRRIGQDSLADGFIKTMNRAAEKSVTSTFNIFVSAIKQMTLKDAVEIYKGSDDEATRYFRRTKGGEIQQTIHPIVKKATQETGVTSNYKKIASKVRKLHPSLAESMPNIDDYVTEKTMDGLFYKIAKEEALIRKDPAARTTETLKKVFSQ